MHFMNNKKRISIEISLKLFSKVSDYTDIGSDNGLASTKH